MNDFKRAEVVMLPTENGGTVCINHNGKMFNRHYSDTKNNYLYIFSDDKIRQGDWVIDSGGIIRKVERINEEGRLHLTDLFSLTILAKSCKKIIATTDLLDRNYNLDRQLPQPSQQFIEKFIEEYNKGNIITDVLVEYQIDWKPETKLYMQSMLDNVDYGEPNLKINSKDNTITIKKIKESWNREEVVERMKLSFNKGIEAESGQLDLYFDMKSWIENKL